MDMIESIVTEGIEVENSCTGVSTVNTETSKTEFVWTLTATWHLVHVRLDMEAEFDHPVCKKKRLWEGVAERVTDRLRAEGYADVPARAFECDLKWRNMLATYRKNAERVRRLGAHAVHWEFFGAMHRVLGRSYEEIEARRKAEINSTKPGKTITSKRYTPILPTPTLPNHAPCPVPALTRPPQDLLQLYLELQERKLNMWAQQKALEERKIEAINNLARAISSLAPDSVATPKNTAVSDLLTSLSFQR
ncbi:uncharacterized protein LOC124396736 [Silurus meridionalis]|uniref:Myb/SANT-like DNA-binding domain-containing protein n=1 Tax=Silurus meridionalis TaxID=175797 RepID=A0A8T0AYI5_SILME|nr:uncharacterized protein LOC124396736 [Silurus meridionalis]KAF7697710.1 hypothetical protein HF521_004220 [Silurus meridionalis]KAI5096980.1 hypothetical protein C0J45_12289 [Silurus meridionalis]